MMGTDPKPRVLRKQVPGDFFLQLAEGLATQPGVSTGAYRIVTTTGGAQLVVYQTNLDLSGYVRQNLTFYPTSAIVQQGEIDNFFTTSASASVFVWDLITTTPVKESDIEEWEIHTVGRTQKIPGFLRSDFSLQEIVYGRLRLFQLKSNVPDNLIQTQLKEWGLLSDTAGHSLYLTRVVMPFLGVTGTISIPEVAFVITGVTSKEKDLVYIQQLARTYELQNTR